VWKLSLNILRAVGGHSLPCPATELMVAIVMLLQSSGKVDRANF
jgi:hypothetical protein